MSLTNVAASSQDQNCDLRDQSSSKLKNGRRQVNWTTNPEKETFRTVVVNYHFSKVDRFRKNQASIPKKRNSWSKMLAKMAAKKVFHCDQEDEDENELSLRKLFKVSEEDFFRSDEDSQPNVTKVIVLSKEELLKESKSENSPISIKHYELSKDLEVLGETVSESNKNHSKINLRSKYGHRITTPDEEYETGNIKVEIYRIPSQLKSNPEKGSSLSADGLKRPVFIDPEVIIISDDEDEAENEIKQVSREDITMVADAKPTDQGSLPHLVEIKPHSSTDIMAKRFQLQHKSDQSKTVATTSSSQKISTLKQRQIELHQQRMAVEKKRLELLETKLAREREEMLREQLMFEKEMELKRSQLRHFKMDLGNL